MAWMKMAKQKGTIPFWAESALQAIYHIDNLCSAVNEGRGVWVSTSALKEAMQLKSFGSYHNDLMKSLVSVGWLEHRKGGNFKPHQYKLTPAAREHLTARFTKACSKCEIEK